jgi:tetratricopeptide (TPR) repeat protein
MRDRAARLAATEREVKRALDEAATLQRQAKWPEALEAAKRAEGLLPGGGSDELRQHVRELRKDLEMVLRLEEIRFPDVVGGAEGRFDEVAADAKYAKAFQEYGIDVGSLEPAEAGARVRARTIRCELAVALDHWVKIRTTMPGGGRKANDLLRKRLLEVARAADPDGWRNRLRDALEHGRTEALTELAASAKVSDLPPQSLSLLGWALDFAGACEQAAAVLRRAQQKYPDDFWINFQLAWSLDHGPRAPSDEVIRFYTVARALRPRNFPVHMFLADKLRARGKVDEAIAVYRRAVELKPDDAAAHVLIASALRGQNKPDEAIAMYRRGLALWEKALGPDHPATLTTMNNLALAYEDAGELGKALPLFEQTLEKVRAKLGPDQPRTLHTMHHLALAYQAAGQFDRAEPLLRELLEQRRKKDGPESLATAADLAALGWNLLKQQKCAAAGPILCECLAIRVQKMPDHYLTFNARSMVGGALLGQKKYAEAEPLLLQAYEGMKRREATIPREGRVRLAEALERLVRLYRATGPKDKADSWAKRFEEANKEAARRAGHGNNPQ